MAAWTKCTTPDGVDIRVNMDHVAMIRSHQSERGFGGSEIIFAVGNLSSIIVKQSQEALAERPQMELSGIRTCETCLDDARVARGIWRSARGRVQVMFPAYARGAITAGPDVVRKPGPNQTDGLNTHVSQRALLADRSTASHHTIITLAIPDLSAA
jgi:hypothetical protein